MFINEEPIHESEIRAEVAALRQEFENRGIELNLEQRMELRDRAMARLVDRLLIFQECRHLGISPLQRDVDEAAEAQSSSAEGAAGGVVDLTEAKRAAEQRLTFERAVAHWCRNLRPPKSTEVRDYYRGHQEQFRRPETVHASHLMRNREDGNVEHKRAEMEEARQRALAGESFATLAETYSDCPENGGDLGFFARGVMVEEFDAIVFAAPLHEVTPVFETRFGIHVAIVHERRPEGLLELSEVGGHIAEALHRRRQDVEVEWQLKTLRRKAVVR